MPKQYRVAYSERVRSELQDLVATAKARGMKQQVLTALKAIDYRLHIYPQFGQPIRDLQLESAKIWIGVVPPLVVQYVIYEDKSEVWVAVPILPLPNSGL